MRVFDILQKDKVITDVQASDKVSAIDSLVDLFKDDERVNDLELMRSAVHEREKIMSTGIGFGFAIPHAKTDGVNKMIAAFAKLKKPIEFESLDNEPVNLIFLLVGEQNAVSTHIKMLSRISRLMNKENFREALKNAQTSEEIYQLFIEEEKNFLELK